MKPYKATLGNCKDMLKLIRAMRSASTMKDSAPVITMSLDEAEAFIKTARKGLRVERWDIMAGRPK